MFGLSATEIFAILIVALLVFGPKQLPKLANRLGKTLRELRQASQEIKAGFEGDLMRDEPLEAPSAIAETPGQRTPEMAASATAQASVAVPLGAAAGPAPGVVSDRDDAPLADNSEAPVPNPKPLTASAPAKLGDLAQTSPRADGDLTARDLHRPDAGI